MNDNYEPSFLSGQVLQPLLHALVLDFVSLSCLRCSCRTLLAAIDKNNGQICKKLYEHMYDTILPAEMSAIFALRFAVQRQALLSTGRYQQGPVILKNENQQIQPRIADLAVITQEEYVSFARDALASNTAGGKGIYYHVQMDSVSERTTVNVIIYPVNRPSVRRILTLDSPKFENRLYLFFDYPSIGLEFKHLINIDNKTILVGDRDNVMSFAHIEDESSLYAFIEEVLEGSPLLLPPLKGNNAVLEFRGKPTQVYKQELDTLLAMLHVLLGDVITIDQCMFLHNKALWACMPAV